MSKYDYVPTGYTTLESCPLPAIPITPAHLPNRSEFDRLVNSIPPASPHLNNFLETFEIEHIESEEDLIASLDALYATDFGDFMANIDKADDFQGNYVRTGHMDTNKSSAMSMSETDWLGEASDKKRKLDSIDHSIERVKDRQKLAPGPDQILDNLLIKYEAQKKAIGPTRVFPETVRNVKWIEDYWLVDTWELFSRFVSMVAGVRQSLNVFVSGVIWTDKLTKLWNSNGILPKVSPNVTRSGLVNPFPLDPLNLPDLVVLGTWCSDLVDYSGEAPVYSLCFDPNTYEKKNSPCLGTKIDQCGVASVRWLSTDTTYHVRKYSTKKLLFLMRIGYNNDWAMAPLSKFISRYKYKGKSKINQFSSAFMICQSVPRSVPIPTGNLGVYLGWNRASYQVTRDKFRFCPPQNSSYIFKREIGDSVCKWSFTSDGTHLLLSVEIPYGDIPPDRRDNHHLMFPQDDTFTCLCGQQLPYSEHWQHREVCHSSVPCTCGYCQGSHTNLNIEYDAGVRKERFRVKGYGVWRRGRILMPYVYADDRKLTDYNIFKLPFFLVKAMESSGCFGYPDPCSDGETVWHVAIGAPNYLPVCDSRPVICSPFWQESGEEKKVSWMRAPQIGSEFWKNWLKFWDPPNLSVHRDQPIPEDVESVSPWC